MAALVADEAPGGNLDAHVEDPTRRRRGHGAQQRLLRPWLFLVSSGALVATDVAYDLLQLMRRWTAGTTRAFPAVGCCTKRCCRHFRGSRWMMKTSNAIHQV